MKKNMALMALTGVLTLASCGQNQAPATDVCAAASACTVKLSLSGVDKAQVMFDGKTVDVVNGSVLTVSKAGKYTVTPVAKDGFTNSGAVEVEFKTAGQQIATVTYTAKPVTPPAPTTRNVKIDLDGVAKARLTVVDDSGAVVAGYDKKEVADMQVITLPDGKYTFKFEAINGFNTPAPQAVAVSGADVTVVAAYTAVAPMDVTIVAEADGKILPISQDIEGKKTVVTYAKGKVRIDPMVAANGADRVEVFLNSTTDDLNAGNRIYDSREAGSESKLILDTATLRQGELQYVVVRYWKGTQNFTKSQIIVPDNLGPQVPDVLPVSKLSDDLTRQKGNWVNGTVKLSFSNVVTLRDNPQGTSFLSSGLERVEWYADKADGVATPETGTKLGTAYSTPWDINVDTKTLVDGKYDVYAVAFDQMGNRSIVNAQNLFVLNIDNAGPVFNPLNNLFEVVDAGTGAVLDELGKGGLTAQYQRRSATDCRIDAVGANRGNTDLFDSTSKYISGLARVTSLKFTSGMTDAGVGLSGSGQSSVTIDGQPLVERLYVLDGSGNLVPRGNLNDVTTTTTPCVYLNVNGLDAGEAKVRFNFGSVMTDLLGNTAADQPNVDISVFVDNQRPSNLRFTRKPQTVAANGQATLAATADDSISGIAGMPTFFARDTNGTAFDGRAVQLASADQTNFRFFRPSNSNQLDVLTYVRDNAGNVSSLREDIQVSFANAGRLFTLQDDNFFIRRQQANGQFLPFGEATNEKPVTGPIGTIHSLDLLNNVGTKFSTADVLSANFYQEVVADDVLNRIGKGTNDQRNDDLNIEGTQGKAPLFLIAATESAPYRAIKALEAGKFAYHAATIDKNGWVSKVVAPITVAAPAPQQ